MVRGRRRRAKYTWLPTLGQVSTDGDTSYGTTYFGGEIAADGCAFGPQDLYVTPIVPDKTFFPDVNLDGASQTQTLRDFTEGQDWLLKRIVGRIEVACELAAGDDTAIAPYVMIGAAFFVGRADDNNESVPDTNNSEIDPLGSRNVRQPWIWRRTWLLRNQGSVATGFNRTYADISSSNGLRSGNAEGPVIDSKVARRIRREERLWFVINAYAGLTPACTTAPPGGFTGSELAVAFNLDYRILGAMRRSNNKSTF